MLTWASANVAIPAWQAQEALSKDKASEHNRGDGGLEHGHGKHRAGRFAEPHIQVQKGRLAKTLQQARVARLGGDMTDNAVIERAGLGLVQGGGSGGADESVEHHGHAPQAGGVDGAGDCRKFPPAEAAQDRQAIRQRCTIHGQTSIDDPPFVGQCRAGNAGSGTGPFAAAAAVKPGAHRRRRRSVGDAHLAQAEHVEAVFCRRHATSEGGQECRLVHGWAGGEIGRRRFQVKRLDRQGDIESPAKLIDGGTAGRKIGDHLRRHVCRKGRNAMRRDTMIASEYRRFHPIGVGRMTALPARHPNDEILQTTKCAWGFRQLRFTRRHRLDRRIVRRGQRRKALAQRVKGDWGRTFRHVDSGLNQAAPNRRGDVGDGRL